MTDHEFITIVCKKRKEPRERDTITIHGTQGPVVLRAWDQGILPHEMVHWAVEAVFPLRGFVRLTAAGICSETMVAEKDPQAMLSEAYTNAYQYELGHLTPADNASWRRLVREFFGEHAALEFDASGADIDAGRRQLSNLDRRWLALPFGGHLELELSP